LDGRLPAQLQLDFRTGRPTAISGAGTSSSERAACTALDAQRALGILQISQVSLSRESLPPDVWAAAFSRRTREWDVPLISLAKLGLEEDGFEMPFRTPETFEKVERPRSASPSRM
jgi:hypothetical protein